MTDALGLECLQLSQELDALAARSDAAQAEVVASVRARLAALTARLREFMAAVEREGGQRREALAARLRDLRTVVERVDAAVAVPAEFLVPRDLLAEASAACGALAEALREPVPRPARPVNHARSVAHVASGTATLFLLHALPGRAWTIAASGAFAALAWTLEISRARSARVNAVLMRVLAPIAHPHEWTRVNSSTWYCTALFTLAIVCARPACVAGVAVLALADPAAGFVGRRWGRTRIRHGRSLEGSLAFVVAGTVAAALALTLFERVPVGTAVLQAAAAALAGALAEIVSSKLDDNLTIPLAAGAAATLFGLR